MLEITDIKGIIFDYGGTIDSNGKHWAEVLWEAYEVHSVPVTKSQFREAYVYGERYLATHPVIQPSDNFLDLLLKKTSIQIEYLKEKGFLTGSDKTSDYFVDISNQCYNFVLSILKKAKPIIEELSQRYPLVLVSNFYGNVRAILQDFALYPYFDDIVESAVVGVRKPDPAIFALGVEALGFAPENIVVIGDSYSKDIVPAHSLGCRTIWLKGPGWDDTENEDISSSDVIITDFSALKDVFNGLNFKNQL